MTELDPREKEGVRDPPIAVRARRLLVPGGASPAIRLAVALDRLRLGTGAWLEREIEAGRSFPWLPVLFGIGALIYFALPSEPSFAALAGLGVLLWALAILRRQRAGAVRLLIVLAMVASGAAAMKLRTDNLATRVLERQVTGTVTGWVEERKARRGGYRLTLRVASLEAKRVATVPQRVTVTVRGRSAPNVGDGVQVLARLRPASGPVLPGGYDFARDSYFRGIGATGFAYGAAKPADLGPPPLSIRLRQPLEAVREAIRARIVAGVDGESRYIASALIIGDAGGLAEKTEDDLRLSGLAHVLSVSGLHMVLVTGVVFWSVRAGLALIPSLALRRPIKKWAAIAALLVSGFYLLISGLDVAAQRSFIMTSIVFLAILLDRRAISMRNVALAGLLVLAITPESILSASFQMSFAATVALVAGFEILADRRRNRAEPALVRNRTGARAVPRRLALFVGAMAVTSLLGGLGTTPFALYHFQRMAPLSILANVAAMPLTDFLVMPAALLSVLAMPFGLEALPLWVMDWGIGGMLGVSATVSRWSGQSGGAAMPGVAALLLFVAGFVWLALWRERWRLLGVLPMLLGTALALAPARPGILVAADGRQLAIRGGDGAYRIVARGQDRFTTEIWLRSDGDGRDARQGGVVQASGCDASGCIGLLPDGRRVALALDRSAFEEDCRRASLVVTPLSAPENCARHALVIDRHALARSGSIALLSLEQGTSPTSLTGDALASGTSEPSRNEPAGPTATNIASQNSGAPVEAEVRPPSDAASNGASPLFPGRLAAGGEAIHGKGAGEPPSPKLAAVDPDGDSAAADGVDMEFLPPSSGGQESTNPKGGRLRGLEPQGTGSGDIERRNSAPGVRETTDVGANGDLASSAPENGPSRYHLVERNADGEDMLSPVASDEAPEVTAGTGTRLADAFEIRTAYPPVRRPWMPAYEAEPVDQ